MAPNQLSRFALFWVPRSTVTKKSAGCAIVSLMAKKKYGPGRFLFDLFMTAITGGLWLIWIVFKFLRTN